MANLLAEPVAQTAINDLWKVMLSVIFSQQNSSIFFLFQDLISKGPQWEEIYVDMHKESGHHNIQTATATTTTTATTTNIETITTTAGGSEETNKNLM